MKIIMDFKWKGHIHLPKNFKINVFFSFQLFETQHACFVVRISELIL